MAVNRNSRRILTAFGTEVTATEVTATLVNTIRFGVGGERTTSAALDRFQGQAVEQASLPINDFDIAVADLTRRGAEPLAARTMALIFIDVARVLQVSVHSLLNNANDEQLKLAEAATYQYLNLLRRNTSQLSGANNVSNEQSYRARYLIP